MKKIVKPKNRLAFRIWLEKLGYAIKQLENGFSAKGKCTKHTYALVLNDLTGNEAAYILGQEFETHLRSPDFMEIDLNEVKA
ncbi:response regulator [Acinetobacter rudis]|uniref:response regulator n=1 Tax=Acinetobacter rudis TaxID=632955 RepID=UPI00333F46D9